MHPQPSPRVGTLLLGDAKPPAVARLLSGVPVKLTELFPDDGTQTGVAEQAKARKAADLLAAKGNRGEEETGDSPVQLALLLAAVHSRSFRGRGRSRRWN